MVRPKNFLIRVDKRTARMLKKLKITGMETYDEVITRLIELYLIQPQQPIEIVEGNTLVNTDDKE